MRALTVIIVLGATAPLIRFAIPRLPLFGINRPAKMTAQDTATAVRPWLPWRPVDDPERDVQCEKPPTAGWDYICTFVPQPKMSLKRLKVGVRVGHDRIKQVSSPHELNARYIRY